MSVTTVQTACVEGGRVLPVSVEVDVRPGLPMFTIIGLPDKRIDESRERVRAALRNCGLPFPNGRVTVNLAPATVRKHGTGFDLAIALGLAKSAGYRFEVEGWVLGELGLEGDVRPHPHLVAILAEAAATGVKCVIPGSQLTHAGLVQGALVAPMSHLSSIVSSADFKTVVRPRRKALKHGLYLIDQIVGQESAKRALAIALLGKFHLFLTGPPGAGKSSLALAAAELLPDLNQEDERWVVQLRSFAGEAYDFSGRPPFRAVSPPVSNRVLLGGGTPVKPGEFSLGHGGVLLLDEFANFSRGVRDALRRPLETRSIRHVRDGVVYNFPCDATVIATQNACPCGRLGDELEECTCSAAELSRHAQSVSGPILDRFQLFVDVSRLKTSDWERYLVPEKLSGEYIASRLKIIKNVTPPLTSDAEQFLKKSVDVHHLSGRGVANIRAVAATISRFDDLSQVGVEQIAEALQYRRRSTSL